MSRYDEDTIVTLLHDAVPPVPDGPDRIDLIRQRAGRQRAALWTQALGAVASVLLIVGVAAAVSNAGAPPSVVRPVSNPLDVLGEALTDLTSVRFEASMQPVGTVDPRGLQMSAAQLEDMLTSHVSGALAENGDFEITGDLSLMSLGAPARIDMPSDLTFKLVDGVSYRTALAFENAPAGKTWVREDDGDSTSKDDVVAELLLLKRFAEDVHYTGNTTVRGEPVAEYAFTVSKGILPTKIDATFALDTRNRLRRATAVLSWRDFFESEDDAQRNAGMDRLVVRVELLAFGYGENVRIARPPAAETIDESDLDHTVSPQPIDGDQTSAVFEQCAEQAQDKVSHDVDATKYQECMARFVPGVESSVSGATMVPLQPSP